MNRGYFYNQVKLANVWSSNAKPILQNSKRHALYSLLNNWLSKSLELGFGAAVSELPANSCQQHSLLVQDCKAFSRARGTVVHKPKAWSCRQRQACIYEWKAFMQLYSFFLCNIPHVSLENSKLRDNIVPTAWEGKGETVCPLIFCKPWKQQLSGRAGEMSCAVTNLQPDCWLTNRFFHLSFLSRQHPFK